MRISAIVTIRDDEQTVAELFRRLCGTLAAMTGGDYEIVFVNDGSADHSYAALEALAWTDAHVVAVDLLRRYGEPGATLCGIERASGEIVVTLAGDLSHPPEAIPRLVEGIAERELDAVYGVSADGFRGDPGRAVFDLACRRFLGVGARIGSFRALRGETAKHLVKRGVGGAHLDEAIAWFTSRVGEAEVAVPRKPFGARLRDSLGAFRAAAEIAVSSSLAPLRMASLAGAALAFTGIAAAILVIGKKLLFGIPVTGYASLIVSICVFSGAQLLLGGLLAGHLARLRRDASGRPLFAIRAVARASDGSAEVASGEESGD